MKKLITGATLALGLCGGAVANSGLELEPMLTWERGEGDNRDISGPGVGARLGFQAWNVLSIGADGRYSAPRFEAQADNWSFDASSRAWNVGPYVALQLPTVLSPRIWGSWIMTGGLDPERDAGVNPELRDARGFRLGAGIRLGWASLNLEYQDIRYNTTRVAWDSTPITGGFDSDLSYDSWILSLSFPFHL
jgi:hypothetical protein